MSKTTSREAPATTAEPAAEPRKQTPALAYNDAVDAARYLARSLLAVPASERAQWAMYTLEMIESHGALSGVELAQMHEKLGQRLEEGRWS